MTDTQRRMFGALAPAGAHLLLALVVSAPMVLRPFRDLVGSPDVDVWNHAWGPWWWANSLLEGTLPWRTELLHWPDGGVLWFIDPVLALVGAPLVLLLGPIAGFNLTVLLYLAATSWAGRRLATSLGASEAASWVGAVGLTASAWVVCELHNGITEAFDLAPLALALAWTEDASRARTPGAWAKAGLGVGLATVASPYLGLGAGIAALLRGLPHIRWAWVGGLVGALVGAPPVLALRGQLTAPDAIIKHPDTMNDQLALHNAVDPRTFLWPGGFRSVDLSAEGFEHSMYLGLVVVALAFGALALRERRRATLIWWLAALLCVVMALGPYLFYAGDWLRTAEGGRWRLPWWAMQGLAPGLAVTHPLRLAAPALAILSGLAAVGATALSARPPFASRPHWIIALVALVGLDGLVLSGAPWPLRTAPATAPAAYEALARERGSPVEHAILDLPTDAGATMATSRYLFWQSAHRRPIPYGPDARASTASLVSEPPFKALAALSRRRDDEQKRLGLILSGPGGSHPSRLRNHGVRWLVLHHDLDPLVTGEIRAALEADLGPGEQVEGTTVWDLGP